jgi:hypothetical protein
MTMIHFQDSGLANENKYVRDFKIRSLINKINTSFRQFGMFGKNLSADEMIV